ncbi:MAG: 3-isopropylmalate dehydratase large subunit [Candidatus Methanomethylicota archaeon]|uniref:3-isopropylmalate dehydratase large subunit n=1 Tax=Thermoproteota archaeon TaxID=2056631 RepID=A0A497EW58_9CREN|nr:MAG: 3-isopropylmalate dehydratase large subunit [Candidatus Verstraetearchaeota archaeon]
MGMTISEKILARASGKERVEPGEYVNAKIDLAMFHDLTGPLTLKVLEEVGFDKPWDPEKIVVVFDHQVPAESVKTAELHKMLRSYVKKAGIRKFYDVGRGGIAHQVLVEDGLAQPGMLIVGADSHTCTYGAVGAFATGIGSTEMAAAMLTGELWFKVPETINFKVVGRLGRGVYAKYVILHIIGEIGVDGALYKAAEFTGPVVERMDIGERMVLTNMAVEMGAKTGIVNPDDKTISYVTQRASLRYSPVRSDPDAQYYSIVEVDASALEPQVACPHSVDNVKPVSEVEGVPIDQVFIGSCTNGRLEDLEVAAKILSGRKVHSNTRLIVIPASQKVYLEALRRGIVETIVKAGGVVANPNCGPCLGGHMGLLADGEKALSTSNRNFVGRMGSPKAEIYLASPATAAATAIEGCIADPRKYLR